MNTIVETQRMKLYPVTNAEIKALITAEEDPGMKQAYSEMLAGCEEKPEQRIWFAVWNMQLKDGTDRNIGDFSFKGLNENGMVEIGYGIKPEFEGKGYMTEAVTAISAWASKQEGVHLMEAETEPDNKASQRVLEKAGYVPNGVMGVEGPRFSYQLR